MEPKSLFYLNDKRKKIVQHDLWFVIFLGSNVQSFTWKEMWVNNLCPNNVNDFYINQSEIIKINY